MATMMLLDFKPESKDMIKHFKHIFLLQILDKVPQSKNLEFNKVNS